MPGHSKDSEEKNSIENIPTCPQCGLDIQDSLNFCENCGNDLKSLESITESSYIENNKNTLIIGITIIIVLLIIGITITVTSNIGTQTVTVGSLDFTIPRDYKLIPDSVDFKFNGYKAMYVKGYSNGEDTIFIGAVSVPSGGDGESLAAINEGEPKTLMGQTGYYIKYDEYYAFSFYEDNYVTSVLVTDPNIFNNITYLGHSQNN